MVDTVSNLEQKKQEYARQIFNIIRMHQPISRNDIKKLSRYSMTTTLAVVDELIKREAVVEVGAGESKYGRKPIWLTVNPSGGYFIGVDISAQEIISVAVDLSGKVRYVDHCMLSCTQRKAPVVLAEICNSIKSLISRLPLNANIIGIGLGLPGYIDKEKGIVQHYAFIEDWECVPIKQYIEDAFHLAVYIENNVSCMALAYTWQENIPADSPLVYLSLRSGIRMGSVLNGALYSGAANTAGEIDHMSVGGHRKCHCGRTGCLVTEASVAGILDKLTDGLRQGKFLPLMSHIDHDMTRLTLRAFIECVLENDPECNAVLAEAAAAAGEAAANIIMMLNPSDIVISSPLSMCGARFLRGIQEEAQRRVPAQGPSRSNIRYCKFGDHIGALGAATLVMRDYSPLE